MFNTLREKHGIRQAVKVANTAFVEYESLVEKLNDLYQKLGDAEDDSKYAEVEIINDLIQMVIIDIKQADIAIDALVEQKTEEYNISANDLRRGRYGIYTESKLHSGRIRTHIPLIVGGVLKNCITPSLKHRFEPELFKCDHWLELLDSPSGKLDTDKINFSASYKVKGGLLKSVLDRHDPSLEHKYEQEFRDEVLYMLDDWYLLPLLKRHINDLSLTALIILLTECIGNSSVLWWDINDVSTLLGFDKKFIFVYPYIADEISTHSEPYLKPYCDELIDKLHYVVYTKQPLPGEENESN